MADNDHKTWSEEYERFIYKDENGEWMIDEFGPTDEFSAVRELRRLQEDLKSEGSDLNPEVPLPTDEYSRFRARQEGDVDAFYLASLEKKISNLEQIIQDELEWEQQVSDGKTGGRPGMDKDVFRADLQTVLGDLEAVAQNNPHKKITNTRIARELIDKHGYNRTEKYLAEIVSKILPE